MQKFALRDQKKQEEQEGRLIMDDHQRSFKNLMHTCTNMAQKENAKKIYRPIDRDLFRLDRE